MTQNAAVPAEQDARTAVFTAYELDFMLSLRPTDSGAISRDRLSLRSAPPEAQEFVTAAVASGLRARHKVQRSEDGQWLLGEEGRVIATTLTAADRWLTFALAEGEALRMSFVVKAEDAIVMLTQDELDSFTVSAVADPSHVPTAVGDVVSAFLAEGHERTVSLRRSERSEPDLEVPLMLHVQPDGSWQVAHLPVDADGILTVSPIDRSQVASAVGALWESGTSAAPAA